MPQLSAKKRVVFTTWGSLGDLHPYLALALELKRRGHHPTITTLPYYRQKIEAAGLAFRPLRPDLPADSDEAMIGLARRLLDARDGPRYLFCNLFNPHLRETYEDMLAAITADGKVDLLVSHQVPMIAPMVAEKTAVQWISAVLSPGAFLSAYDPPTPPQLPALQKIAAAHPSIAHMIYHLGKWSTRSWVKPVYQLREELGLPRGKHPIFEGQHSPTLVLGLFSKVLAQIQPDFPPQAVITGFPFYDSSDEQPPAPELWRFLDAGEPPILFTLGSSAVWIAEDFYRTSIEAARQLNRRALLLVGDQRNLPCERLPDTVAAFDYAPHGWVMPRASVIVHQGGIGTTGQALRSGKPMLVIPFGQDQPDNARRCVRLGVARMLARTRYTASRLVSELSELLTDPAYRERAADVGREVQSEEGVDRACDAIEQVLRSVCAS